MTSIDRTKFTTENGRKLYDLLKPIAHHEDWLFAMFMFTKGEDQKEKLINFIKSGHKDIKSITNFVMKELNNLI